jgi:hypothetical protein
MGRTDTDALNTEACSEAYYLPLLAITGLAREARLATGPGIVTISAGIAAAFAAKHGLPFAAVRVVCDPADRTLPSCVVSALRPNGSVNVVAVVGALADRSAKLGDLVQLARDSRRAFKALRYCRRALSQDLGIATIREPMGVVLPTTLTLAP